jgi:thymidylate kinase
MLFLFEGLDKSGKTTLIKNFVDLSGIDVFKNPIKPTDKMYDRGFVNGTYFGAYEAARVGKQDLIFDRSHITEIAYAEVKRGYKPSKNFWLKWEELNKHYVVVVYVDAPLETVKERFKTDKEEYVKEKEIELIAKKYEEYFKKSKLSFVYIDGSHDRQRMLSQLVIQLNNLHFWTARRSR